MGAHTLVLNASFEPLNVVSWQRAIQLLVQGKVEVIEESEHEVRTVRFAIRVPSVLRLLQFIPLTHRKHLIRFSRNNVFLRDHFKCQYCGHKLARSQLTLDHVIPVAQGGRKSWENIVSSCRPCNQKKGGRTPEQAGMSLVRLPVEPAWLPQTTFELEIRKTPTSWKIYLSRRTT